MHRLPLGSFLSRALLAAVFLAACLQPVSATNRAPNIVLLVAEGIGAIDPSAATKPDVPTPRLDQLAAGGLRLLQSYASSPSAALDHAALGTGRHPVRIEGASPTSAEAGSTLVRILGAQGYATATYPAEVAGSAASKAPAYPFAPITGEACSFIDRNRERPFFLHLRWRLPDNPARADENRLKRYERLGDLRRRHRAAGLVDIDESVGRVIHRLRAHKLEENTLVIFISEPGGFGGHEGVEALSEANLRASFLVRWSGRMPAAKLDPRLCSTLDVFPTCLAAAQVAVPTDLVFDGVNLLPFLERRISKAPHAALHWRVGGAGAVRQGEWKWVRDIQRNNERMVAVREVDGQFSEVALSDSKRLQTLRAAWDSWNQAPNRPPWERWENDIKAFEQSDRTNPPPRNAVLFLGSSTIRLWKTLASDFPEVRVVNRGFGGSETVDSVAYFDRLVMPHQPRTIVFYGGDNDLSTGRWPEQILVDFQTLANRARAALPEVRILFLAIKPSPSRRGLLDQARFTNRLIEDYCQGKPGLEYVDVFTPTLGTNGQPRPELFAQDELHLNAEGYALWAEVLRPLLK